MNTLWQDLRYGIRVLLNSRGFTLAAVFCLALGIGATTAIFTVVDAVVMRPLPYLEPQRLVRIYSEFPAFPGGGLRRFWISPPEFLDLERDAKQWESINGWVNGGANLAGADEPIRVTASYVTGNLMRTLGVSPLLGRLVTPQDDAFGAPQVAVISYGLWQRGFGGDPKILGRDARLDSSRCVIVGVMPNGFQFPPGEIDAPEVWTPLQLNRNSPGSRGSHYLSLLGRVKPGVSVEQARQELNQLTQSYGEADSQRMHALHPERHPLVSYPLHDEVVGGVRTAMLMLLGAVAFVLLIACVNVANLLLARAESRQREIAVRTALGAATSRLARQFVTEGVLLSFMGAVCGLLLAFAGLRLIISAGAASIPRSNEIHLDVRVLLFTLAVSLVTGVLFGLAPLAQATIGNLHESLKAAAGRATSTIAANRFRSALVVAELGLALVLLIGTGLMIRAFWKLQQVNAGFQAQGLLTMRVALPQVVYAKDEDVKAFWTSALERLSRLPGATSVSMMTGMPPQRRLNANDTFIEGFVPKPGGPVQNVDYYNGVSDRYFETMGMPVIEGRAFDSRDGAGAPLVVVINQTMARTFWPGESPLGRRIRPGGREWTTVIGVVADVKNAGLDKPTGTELYLPLRQGSGARTANVVIRTAGDPLALVTGARSILREMDASLPVSNVRTMDDVIYSTQARPRFLALLLTMFSVVALGLAAVGIYGVISYAVAQRTNEFGIRLAMGAGRQDILRMVLAQGMLLGAIGVVLGAIGAIGLTRYIKGLLFGISSFDPVTFLAMAAALLAVTLAACYVPARRATKVDPMVALRYE
jgi:putative ABC transport system permease protein